MNAWLDQFQDKLFPIDSRNLDIDGAYRVKDENLPSSIFKYREKNDRTLRNLCEDTVWLANPESLNDPYDCLAYFDFEYVQRERSSEIFDHMPNQADLDRHLGPNWRSEAENSSNPVQAHLSMLIDKFPEQQRPILHEMYKDILRDLTLSISQKALNNFRLCSFSERVDSMLMWAHYSDYHKGFCIEYDISLLPSEAHLRRFLYPIIYSDTVFDGSANIARFGQDENLSNLYLSRAALIKAKDWEYEKEWRLLFSHDIIPNPQTFKMGRPKALYLGAKTSKDDQKRLLEICSEKNLPIYKMRITQNKYALEPVLIDDANQRFFLGR